MGEVGSTLRPFGSASISRPETNPLSSTRISQDARTGLGGGAGRRSKDGESAKQKFGVKDGNRIKPDKSQQRSGFLEISDIEESKVDESSMVSVTPSTDDTLNADDLCTVSPMEVSLNSTLVPAQRDASSRAGEGGDHQEAEAAAGEGDQNIPAQLDTSSSRDGRAGEGREHQEKEATKKKLKGEERTKAREKEAAIQQEVTRGARRDAKEKEKVKKKQSVADAADRKLDAEVGVPLLAGGQSSTSRSVHESGIPSSSSLRRHGPTHQPASSASPEEVNQTCPSPPTQPRDGPTQHPTSASPEDPNQSQTRPSLHTQPRDEADGGKEKSVVTSAPPPPQSATTSQVTQNLVS